MYNISNNNGKYTLKTENIKVLLSVVVVFIATVFIASCDKDERQNTIAPDIKSNRYNNHGVEFEYPGTWRLTSDMVTGFGDITVILSTNDITNIFVKIFPKEKSGDLTKLVKTYDRQYYIPIFTKPKPKYKWSTITLNQHIGMRKIHDTLNPDLKPFINEYFRFQLGDRAALVVMESNQKEYLKYGDELDLLLNTMKVTK